MNHHAYFVAGDLEKGIQAAERFAEHSLGLNIERNPDVITLRYGLFSVDDARAVKELAERAPLTGDSKVIILAAGRMFHEAQNALLKLFEEPPAGVTLILIVPSAGILLPTLRSRLLSLAKTTPSKSASEESDIAEVFLSGTKDKREKIVAKLLERAKSDKDEEKQAARLEALSLAESLMRASYAARLEGAENEKTLNAFLEDLSAFIPILHERSAPLKPIFEHLLLTIPPGLGRA